HKTQVCWVSLLLFLFCHLTSQAHEARSSTPVLEYLSENFINNVVQDPRTGRIYLGAVNTIYQLGPSLQMEARAETGPKEDARTCTPPASACQDTKPMPNLNKLLLVHPSNGSLIVCGSRYRGICSLLNLTNVEQQLYYSDSKGERTYVASIEDNVNVVAVMSSYSKDGQNFSVFLVGKGYGTLDSTKLISTRILQDFREWVVFESIIEASTVQTTPFAPKYLHDFRHAFKEDGFVYFLFSRTLDGTDNKNLTFVSRLCEEDHHYYSHTELQLNCGPNNRYNKVQAAFVASPGKELARVMTESSSDSALCMYPLSSINERLVDIISACYSDSGKIGGYPAVHIPYTTKTEEFCTSNIGVRGHCSTQLLKNFTCGADFLPSPLASKPRFALKANAVLTMSSLLTAVAVAVENDHTIAFLGNNKGEVFKVKLFSDVLFFSIFFSNYFTSGKDNSVLMSDVNFFNLYITTEKKITKVPVQTCLQKKDCQSCVELKDPYCGWCVLEGRCTRRSECRRAEEKNGWLWSPKQQCVKIVSFFPANLSFDLTIFFSPPYFFLHLFHAEECVMNELCLCEVVEIHFVVSSMDFCVGRSLMSLHVFSFCLCVLLCVCELLPNYVWESIFSSLCVCVLRCMSCVSSQWGCQWNVHDHTCSDMDNTEVKGNGSLEFALYTLQYCNILYLTIYFFYLLITSHTVTLYNCSMGREDCSLCKNADPKYRCVWCAKQKACVYEKLCSTQGLENPYEIECPAPQISYIIPHFGPLKGGISITIRGSNLGIHKEDIKSITVVGAPCKHQEEKYSVSTSVVCEIGPGDPENLWGPVEVELKGGKRGTSLLHFTYRNPIPDAVKPAKGPKAGGTLITITGKFLDTGSREDVQVTIGGVECTVEQFGPVITCRTGEYRADKVPSDPLTVTMKYGKSTTTSIPSAFQFMENPTILDHDDLKVGLPLQGRGFSKAMTAKEAQAFVGDVLCVVNTLQDEKLFLDPPSTTPRARSRRHRRDTRPELLDLMIKFGKGEWVVGSVQYEQKNDLSLYIIIPAVIVPMLLIIAISVYCYRRKSQQAEREYEKVKHQLENLEESVRDRCKKEFTDLMIEMEDHTNDLSEGRIPFLDYKTYTDRVFFLPSKDGANDVMITGRLDIPEARRAVVTQALNQFSNLLNSKTFLINFIRTLERSHDFNARAKVYFASLLTVALHGKLEYYTDIMRTLLLELMNDYVNSKNPKLMLRRSETVVERMLCNWMSICLYQFLKDSAGEPLYKLFRAIKHQIEKGPVDARLKKAKYTLNDTGLLGDDVEYSVLTLQVLVHGEGPDVTPVKVLNCDTISQVKEKIIEQVYRNLPYSLRPKVDSVTLEWRPGSTGQILSDLDLTSQKEGRWKRVNTLAHYNVRDNATLVLSRVVHTQQNYDQNQENHEERNALLEDDKVFHLVRPTDELDEIKSKRGSIKDKSMTKAITEIYLTRLLSVKGTLQQFVDDFFRGVLCSVAVVPPAVKYFFDFLDEQALKHNVDEETIHIWKTNSLPLRFWVNILKNPHFIFDVHVSEMVDASLSVIAQTFMDACTKSEHKLSRDSPSNKLLYAKEISTYKKMVDDYYKGVRKMVPVSDQDMNTHLAEVSRSHTDRLNTQVALHQLYQYASKYYDGIIASLDEDPAAQSKQLTLRLQQIAAALENKVTDL
uniref:Sema domain-containing protein n=1 Tax=Anabas testudineus TaxID=64144 RepID=A0A7N6AH01_ANATE